MSSLGVHSGTRITRPNTDDRLVEQWNGSAWSVVGYDSGWRDVSGLLTSGAASILHLRRTGNSVSLRFLGWTSGTFALPLASGFRQVGPTLGTAVSANTATGSGSVSISGAAVAAPTGGAYNYGDAVIVATWVTDDPTPTSLPGTLVTAAPA